MIISLDKVWTEIRKITKKGGRTPKDYFQDDVILAMTYQ
jgi:hypothetical protein